jgi:uncharacterized protein with HEPN domain
MLAAARTVRRFTAGRTWETFRDDEILQNAVLHQVQIIGEAARNVSATFQAAQPLIPWPQIVGMRNRLVHHYFRILPERIWEVVETDIPVLIGQLETLVPPEDGPSGTPETEP